MAELDHTVVPCNIPTRDKLIATSRENPLQ